MDKAQKSMGLDEFKSLPTEKVAQLVRETGPKVCVFPINGTRRWFMLEYPEMAMNGSPDTYLQIAGQRHIELYRLLFDHGIDTLLTPIFGPDLLKARGNEYMPVAVQGLLWLVQNSDLLEFYDAYDIRVRIYGDIQYFQDEPLVQVLNAFSELTQRTVTHERRRLFFGICAHDPTETIAKIGADFYLQFGQLPNRHQIVEAYYGEYVEPVDFFIGFDQPAVFDMPLLATGNEDLYFTVSPSPYLDKAALRMILYDHLYTRQVDESDYTRLSSEDWEWMREFYHANLGQVLGIGKKQKGVWYPLPQVNLLCDDKNCLEEKIESLCTSS